MTGTRTGARATIGRLVAIVLLAGTASLAVPLQQAAQATEGAPTACERVWDALPDAMQNDIRAALSLRPREQHRAMLAIRYAALHGFYGEQVQTWAKALQHRRAEIWKGLPEQLKTDIRAARSLPFREQRRAMVAIRDAALQGAYGDEVQRLAEKRQAFLAGCPDDVKNYVDTAADPLAG
jgi:hypothetical protein